MFPDGTIKEYAENLIAENMLAQVDSEGFSTTIFDKITDHKKVKLVTPNSDKYIIIKRD